MHYQPIDISPDILQQSAAELLKHHAGLSITGYVCDYLGVHKSRSGRLPLRSARYGALIFRSATGGWRAMTGRVVLRAGTTYNFRCNDTDFNNEGELTVTFQEVDR